MRIQDNQIMFFILSALLISHCSAENTDSQFRVIEGNKIPIAILERCKGNIVDTACWQELNGRFVFVACEIECGTGGEASWKSELYVRLYKVHKNDSIEQLWRIYDFNNDPLTSVRYMKKTRKIVDIDNDKKYETIFMYKKPTDCCDPWTVKLMLHKDDEKLAVRGEIPIIEEDLESYQKNFDPIYEKYDKRIRDFASEQWDKGIRMYWKDILGDSLAEQIIMTQNKTED